MCVCVFLFIHFIQILKKKKKNFFKIFSNEF